MLRRFAKAFFQALLTAFHGLYPILKYLVLRIRFNHVMLYTSSLAYSLLVAFIPLIASLSLFASKMYELNKSKISIFLSQKEINALILKFLPYSTVEINETITRLVKNASTIGWVGTVGLFFSVVLLYGTIEEIFNETWRVKQGRPIYKNVGMVLWITLLFTLVFGLYVRIGTLPLLKMNWLFYFSGKGTALFLLILSFALLFKFIPAIRVSWRASLTGGLFSAIFYEICRVGLHLSVNHLFSYNKIWGSLSLLPLFVLTIYLLSLIIVLGNEVTYLVQNHEDALEGHRLDARKKRSGLVAYLDERRKGKVKTRTNGQPAGNPLPR